MAGYTPVSGKQMRRLLSYILPLVIGLFSCEDDIEPFNNEGLNFEFYPLEIGVFRTYQVDEISYEISGFDTSSYYLREILVDSFNVGGLTTYLLQRESRIDTTGIWTVDSLWSIRIQDNQLILTKNNLQTVRLIFPPQIGREWDANAFNTRSRDVFSYVNVDIEELETSNSLLKGLELIKVEIEDLPENIVNQNQQWEVYGKGIGLIEKKSIILDFCTVDCDSTGQILSGSFLSQQLIEYGKE